METILRHKLILITIAIQLIALPLILLAVKERQETRTRAAANTALFFSPASTSDSPINVSVGQEFSVDLMVNPGSNMISLAKVDVSYDPAKVELSPINPVVINLDSFPITVEGPINSPGRIQIIVSIKPDEGVAVTTETKILTLNFIAKEASSQTALSFGTDNQLLSIAPEDTFYDNVLETTTPATLAIGQGSTPTPTSEPNVSETPTPTPSTSPTPTPGEPSPTPPETSPTPQTSPTPTPEVTPPPNTTLLYLTGLKLHGIGKGGDNPNPNSGGTLNPLRLNRSLIVDIYNASGALINTITGGIAYDGPQNGTFDGLITLPNTIESGDYLIKIKTPSYLRRQLPGFMSLVKGETNNAPATSLVAGDANNDNTLSVADYNLIIDCYSDLLPARDCTQAKKEATDLSDDGKVNQDDYNLFLRELSVQSGD